MVYTLLVTLQQLALGNNNFQTLPTTAQSTNTTLHSGGMEQHIPVFSPITICKSSSAKNPIKQPLFNH